MTGGTTSLAPEQLQTFRESNAASKDMKGTYDDPSSPFYHAVRTPTPTTLREGIGQKVPEMLRNFADRVGPEGFGVVRRGVAEKALGTNNEGRFNFKNFGRSSTGYRRTIAFRCSVRRKHR